jgi:hypothetical protein
VETHAALVVVAQMLVEPLVPVRGGYSLCFAPSEKGLDNRVLCPSRFQTPRAGIGEFDSDSAKQRLHLTGAPEIHVFSARHEGEDLVVALLASGSKLRFGRRTRSNPALDVAFGNSAVKWQSVGSKFCTENFDR